MADTDSSHIEEHSDSGLNQSQWQIPFDADKSTGCPESTAAKESGPTEVNPPTTWSFVDYFTK
jgi:hypothetical protein